MRPQADAAALERDERVFQRGQRAGTAWPSRSPSICAAVARLEHGFAQAELEQLGLHLLFGLHVVGVFLVLHAEQRRLGDVDIAPCDQLVHLPIEEREQQRADVRAVDVGVGHDHDLAVAALGQVGLFADARADGRDHAADFFVGQHFVFARLVGVDDLAAQRQDGLILAQPAAFGAAAGRITLDQVQLALVDVAAGAVAQLAGQAAAGERAFALAEQSLAPCGPLSRASAASRPFCTMTLAVLGFSSRYLFRKSPTAELTMPSTSPLPSLVLVWPSNCGSGTRSEITAVSPSRKSSPVGDQVLEQFSFLP